MRKRILVAVSADTVRTVAENILRQNGYEVISVAAGDRATEVLQFSRPDLILVGADLSTSDNVPYYQKLACDPKIGPVPTLVIAPADGSEPEVPTELIIPQPFDPQLLLEKVSAALENKLKPASRSGRSDTGGLNVNDDFLDAALGLDEINVTDSEVLDKTTVPRSKPKGKPVSETMGMDDTNGHSRSDSGRVESLVISEDSTDIVRKDQPSKPAPTMSATGALDIVSDQFGLQDSEAGEPLAEQQGGHDYDWFVDSMRNDVVGPLADGNAPKSPAQPDTGGLSIEPASSAVDPITPGPATVKAAAPSEPAKPAKTEADPGTEKDGVEGFIDEFKKEMEVLRAHEPESIVIKDEDSSVGQSTGDLAWEEQVEKLTPREVGLFTQRLSRELAEKLAEVIAAKIDPEKLLELLKSEIIKQARNK